MTQKKKPVDASQAYFRTGEWERGERKADEGILLGAVLFGWCMAASSPLLLKKLSTASGKSRGGDGAAIRGFC